MSLVGFKAQNHTQQTAKRGPNPLVDDRQTAPEVFAPLHERFHFTVDVAASPPYSSIEPWVAKANAEWARVNGPEIVVMLLPANRTEQGWWQDHVEPRRDRPGGIRVEFLRGRMRFIAPDALEIKPNERPPFGVCLLIWGVA